MITIRILVTPEEMEQVENLQRIVWPGPETDIVPAHLLVTLGNEGGLVFGAFDGEQMVGLLFGFVGLYSTLHGLRPKHCSHQMGVHPSARDTGIGYALKRAQWQMVRQHGLELITWTFDPLLSRNGHLNIGRLGAVCNTFIRQYYGDLRDGLNIGLPSDRFQVDWWVNTRRVAGSMTADPRPTPTMADFTAANVQNLYTVNHKAGFIRPSGPLAIPNGNFLLAEIPVDFSKLKAADFELARDWRMFSRDVFETCFSAGYLITDFIYESNAERPRSFYLLTYGEATL
jgi:predicted GNAT superfamily acetyltransferase